MPLGPASDLRFGISASARTAIYTGRTHVDDQLLNTMAGFLYERYPALAQLLFALILGLKSQPWLKQSFGRMTGSEHDITPLTSYGLR